MKALSFTRRALIASGAETALTLAVIWQSLGAGAIAGPLKKTARDWVKAIELLSRDLSDGAISPMNWQDGLAEIIGGVPLAEVLEAVDFETVAARTEFADLGVATAKLVLPEAAGASRTVYTKLFAVAKGRAIIPHGHAGMASGHLVAKGRFRLRQYEALDRNEDAWLIRQTVDRVEPAGGVSTISDDRDNVHWLVAEEDSYTIDFIMSPAVRGGRWDVQNLDIEAATIDGELIRAPTIDVQSALAKYGRI
jgi:hypothetical protein